MFRLVQVLLLLIFLGNLSACQNIKSDVVKPRTSCSKETQYKDIKNEINQILWKSTTYQDPKDVTKVEQVVKTFIPVNTLQKEAVNCLKQNGFEVTFDKTNQLVAKSDNKKQNPGFYYTVYKIIIKFKNDRSVGLQTQIRTRA